MEIGLSSLQKCTVALYMLAYGVLADACDEYYRLGESTAMEAMKRWVVAIRGYFEAQYLRQSSRADLDRQVQIKIAHGLPDMFAILDCMQWTWKNCLVAWQGQFQDKNKNQSVILEAIADQSLWLWHIFFGLLGGNNDISVLDRSPLIANLLKGEGQNISFHVTGMYIRGTTY